ncbi:MAG: sensor histidine kinase [Pseudomonadota bacterium]
MKSVPHRFIATACTLGGFGVPCHAAQNGTVPGLPMVTLLAVLWLLLLGFTFHGLLRRRVKLDGHYIELQTQLLREQAARVLAERAQADTHAMLCTLVAQQEKVRELERNRIGRDIHDDLGQSLLALKIELSMLHVSTNGAHPVINDKLGRMIASLGMTIKSLRAIINDLRPAALDAGLQSAVERQLDEFSRINGIRCELNAGEHAFDGGGDDTVDTIVFRILQESLSNVVRHAHATEVKIALHRCDEHLTMRVQDNGVGMPCKRASHGCGLLGMQDRVKAIGGEFEIDSKPGAGTVLSLTIPLARPALTH